MKDILQQIQGLQEKFDNLYKTKEGEVGLKFVDGTPQFKAVFQGPDVPKLHKLTDIERARKAQEYRAKHSEYDPEEGMVYHEPPEEEKKPIHNDKPRARLPKGDKKMNDNNSYNEIMTKILNLKEDFMNLIEVEGLGQPASDVPPTTNKIKKDRKTKNGKVELVSVEDELFPYDGNKREQYRQKIIDTINNMIQGTATLEDLLQIVRQKKAPLKEAMEVLESIISEYTEEDRKEAAKKVLPKRTKEYVNSYYDMLNNAEKNDAEQFSPEDIKKFENAQKRCKHAEKVASSSLKEAMEILEAVKDQVKNHQKYHGGAATFSYKGNDYSYSPERGLRKEGKTRDDRNPVQKVVDSSNKEFDKVRKYNYDLDRQSRAVGKKINKEVSKLEKKEGKGAFPGKTNDTIKKLINTANAIKANRADADKNFTEVNKRQQDMANDAGGVKHQMYDVWTSKKGDNFGFKPSVKTSEVVKIGEALSLMEAIINEVSMNKWKEAAASSLPKRQEKALKSEEEGKQIWKDYEEASKKSPEDEPSLYRKAEKDAEAHAEEHKRNVDRVSQAELVSMLRTKGKSANKTIKAAKKVQDERSEDFYENPNAKTLSRKIKASSVAAADPVKSRVGEALGEALSLTEAVINELNSATVNNALNKRIDQSIKADDEDREDFNNILKIKDRDERAKAHKEFKERTNNRLSKENKRLDAYAKFAKKHSEIIESVEKYTDNDGNTHELEFSVDKNKENKYKFDHKINGKSVVSATDSEPNANYERKHAVKNYGLKKVEEALRILEGLFVNDGRGDLIDNDIMNKPGWARKKLQDVATSPIKKFAKGCQRKVNENFDKVEENEYNKCKALTLWEQVISEIEDGAINRAVDSARGIIAFARNIQGMSGSKELKDKIEDAIAKKNHQIEVVTSKKEDKVIDRAKEDEAKKKKRK